MSKNYRKPLIIGSKDPKRGIIIKNAVMPESSDEVEELSAANEILLAEEIAEKQELELEATKDSEENGTDEGATDETDVVEDIIETAKEIFPDAKVEEIKKASKTTGANEDKNKVD